MVIQLTHGTESVRASSSHGSSSDSTVISLALPVPCAHALFNHTVIIFSHTIIFKAVSQGGPSQGSGSMVRCPVTGDHVWDMDLKIDWVYDDLCCAPGTGAGDSVAGD